MGIVQEKFQITEPQGGDGDKTWASDISARKGKQVVSKTNYLPPGMRIEGQANSEINEMEMVMSGESDISKDYNNKAVSNGFTKRKMKATDDMYTREHNDAFYDDCGGFVERNNMLDRL